MNHKNKVLKKYEQLLEMLNLSEDSSEKKVNQIIRASLHHFCNKHQNPAIWCFGKHTRMLMADFMNEMRNVKVIIDSSKKGLENIGFLIITPDEIEKYEIDGIIISSFVYKEEIKSELLKQHNGISYLDIYDELASENIILKSSYFSASHPYSKYQVINQLQIFYENEKNTKSKIEYLKRIIENYILIKDFQTAIKYTKELTKLDETNENQIMLQELNILYELEKAQVSSIGTENVLMLCIDGLRRRDLLDGKLPNLLYWIQQNGYFFDQAYSSSTSTYESLIPVYGSNHDMRTKYYEKSLLSQNECLFIEKACEQDRNIFFYTDTDQFIDCKKIRMSGSSQTITEKIWDFMLDADREDNGLFYLHILYESHYSYANPYTEEPLVADGSNIMFDFLDAKGGRLRTDYGKQQRDSLRYIDSVLLPFLELISCRTVLYADHGNILMKETDTLENLEPSKFSFHKDLIEIPIVIKCPELKPQTDHRLISLMELNNIIVCLLEKKTYKYFESQYIKVQRSTIYNPDFRYLYTKYGKTKELQSFELFIFSDGIHFILYEDGTREIVLNERTMQVKEEELFQSIISDITVCMPQ